MEAVDLSGQGLLCTIEDLPYANAGMAPLLLTEAGDPLVCGGLIDEDACLEYRDKEWWASGQSLIYERERSMSAELEGGGYWVVGGAR